MHIIDKDVIESLKEIGDQEFLVELIELFLAQSDGLVKEIRSFFDENKIENVMKSAHKLKGSALNLGAQHLGSVCQIIEHSARENDIHSISSVLNDFETVYNDTCVELRSFM